MKRTIFILYYFVGVILQAQHLQGIVQDTQKKPIVGANIFWLGTQKGTTTNEKGEFRLEKTSESRHLVFNAVGFVNDTLLIDSQNFVNITLKEENSQIQAVEVKAASSFVDTESPLLNQIITRKEFTKAACCNLSEIFETNASVDVSYPDAVTGTKQIRMLGLEGTYVLINTENLPFMRGLARTYGLNFIPGAWIQSVDLIKGTGSVLNGYESMTGQINVELFKPDLCEETSWITLLNAYLNHFGRAEGNAILTYKISEKWQSSLLAHASTLQNHIDTNQDSFLDLPLYTQYNIVKRFKRQTERWRNEIGIKMLYDDRRGGQSQFWSKNPLPTAYGTQTTAQRGEIFAKNAILYPQKPYQSIGLISSAIWHKQEGFVGQNLYNGTQKTIYNQLIYNNILGNTQHSYKTGITHTIDDFQEQFRDSIFTRREHIVGIFAEYTYTLPQKITLVAGSRLDRHNMFGWIYTPRLHFKYDLAKNTILRLSAGRGFHVPNPIAENWNFLVNNRKIFAEPNLQPEISWNYGISLQKSWQWGMGRKVEWTTDFFRTQFQNQLVVDMDRNATELYFVNLQGQSFANSFQTELTMKVLAGLETKVAYKYYDVQNTLAGRLQASPYISRHRFFINASYETRRSGLQFDATLKWQGRQRLPISHNPLEASQTQYSPAFGLLNAQISKKWNTWEWYVGGENLLGFVQRNPIISADNPQSPHFDATMVWGPIFGRMIYTGVRIKMERKKE
ncbi:MAG: TonB-dependent receptor [Raineya sp.]|nr:TonB-dependent receptor [Raineya sp.]